MPLHCIASYFYALQCIAFQSSQDLASDRDCQAQGRYGSRSPSPAVELKEMVSDRDGDKTQTHALQKSSVLRTPTEYERGRSKQYSSASSVNREGRTSRMGRGKSEEVTGHTKVEESPHELGQRDIRTHPEQHSSGPSHSESEAEMSGSSNSHSESPTPSQDVPITKKEQVLFSDHTRSQAIALLLGRVTVLMVPFAGESSRAFVMLCNFT